jgi:hypothetical protein
LLTENLLVTHCDGLDSDDITARPDIPVDPDRELALFLGAAYPLLHSNLFERAERTNGSIDLPRARQTENKYATLAIVTPGYERAGTRSRARSLGNEHAPWFDDAIHVGVHRGIGVSTV